MNADYPHKAVDIRISECHWQSSDGNFQQALIRALEAMEQSQWRVVCANIMAECCEPYRTLVLSRQVLEDLRIMQLQYRNSLIQSGTPSREEMFRFTAEMHMPLIQDPYAASSFEYERCFSPA